jgi:hypothetical protein
MPTRALARLASPLATALLVVAALVGGGCHSSSGTTCPSGQTACSGACFDLQTSTVSCGACLASCATGATCQAGVCTCPAGEIRCGSAPGACVNPASSAANCGACNHDCGLGTCSAGACDCTGFSTCGAAPHETCVDLQADRANCGACGATCKAGQACVAGSCQCLAGYTDCTGGSPSACFNLAQDEAHCGTSCPGSACATGATCTPTSTGALTGTCLCPAGQIACGTPPGACVTPSTDAANCGACGVRCAVGASCVGGTCAPCPSGGTICGSAPGTCTDLGADHDHCGACATACTAAQTCTQGTCCAAGTVPCGGASKTCCAGNACCGSACQPAHSNGLGQTYYDCAPLGTLSRITAQGAASAWAPSGVDYDLTNCGGGCYARQTSNACAVWCYDGLWVGKANLNTISVSCLCPTGLSPGWN